MTRASESIGRQVLHSARITDCRGTDTDAWVLLQAGQVLARGAGTTWRELPGVEAVRDLAGHHLVPGFIDLHMHGGGGHSNDDGPDSIRRSVATHRAHGTVRTAVSFASAPLPHLLARLRDTARLVQEDHRILGSHLEGPFISTSRRGAHDPRTLRPPDPATIEQILEAADGALLHLTLDPELPGAYKAIQQLVAAGVRVAIGHTNADHDTAARAFDSGASLLTHAFNAMPELLHRAPGPVAAALDRDWVTLELILDGIHVHPRLAAFLLSTAPGRIALVTDAMAAAAAPDGAYRLGPQSIVVREHVAYLDDPSERQTLAGSTLTQDRALRNGLEQGIELTTLLEGLSATPARVAGLPGHGVLQPGLPADLVELDDSLTVVAVHQ